MSYKVLDIYKDLPRTNCGDCGRPTCFAFASAVYLEGASLAECPHLDPERRATMEAKRAAAFQEGAGPRPEVSAQALAYLRGKMGEVDLAERAAACGGTYETGPPEAVVVEFLGTPQRLTRDDVTGVDTAEPTIWVKIFLMIYVTRASGTPGAGTWVAYRELPNTVSKSQSFEAAVGKIAARFGGDLTGLDRAAQALGGELQQFGSADRAYRFRALPRVDLLLLFWDGSEEFEARAALLVDRGVLDYLDQEALVFLAEAFVARCLGGDLAQVTA